jgi:hypothetical protein
MIVNMNLTEYMGPDADRIQAFAEKVDTAIAAGKLSGPFSSRCSECGDRFADADEAYADENHIIVSITSDTFAVVVACEGYYMVNPNLVGIDSPMWSDWTQLPTDVTPDDFA